MLWHWVGLQEMIQGCSNTPKFLGDPTHITWLMFWLFTPNSNDSVATRTGNSPQENLLSVAFLSLIYIGPVYLASIVAEMLNYFLYVSYKST